MKIIMTIVIVINAITATVSAQNQNPCSDPNSSQFDFWVGEWNLSWLDNEGKTLTGKNKVNKIMGGCTIEENFSTDDGSFIGKSFSVYNSQKGYWEQTWVDNSGAYMNFTGGMDGDKMILSRTVTGKQGNEITQRMVFYDISNDKFTWDWESSTDGGTNWNLQWRLNYTRAN